MVFLFFLLKWIHHGLTSKVRRFVNFFHKKSIAFHIFASAHLLASGSWSKRDLIVGNLDSLWTKQNWQSSGRAKTKVRLDFIMFDSLWPKTEVETRLL